MNLTNLPTISALSDSVTIAQLNDIKIIRIVHEKAEGAISLHGGHVLSFKPKSGKELIWMSEKAIFNGSEAIRGGVPICWPWFGRIASPAHGFARNSQWQLLEHRENKHGVIVSLGLSANEKTKSIWPYKFEAVLKIEMGDKLTIRLDVENTDNQPWQCSGALHSYLNIDDIQQSIIKGMGPNYKDSLQEGKLCQGDTTLTVSEHLDRIYTTPEKTVTVSSPNQTISVTNEDNNSVVIWNPWKEIAAEMTDFHNDGYSTMICIESTYYAASLEQKKIVQPNESFKLSTIIEA